MFELQSFLRNTPNALSVLEEKYGIHISRHGKMSQLVQMKYDQIDSPNGEKIVQQCRGIIFDEQDNWKVVCRTYDRFFNYGDGHAAKIDWANARVYEKLDGSLMQLYFYNGEWHVASSGLPDASGNIMMHNMTFSDLFWKTWKSLGYRLPCDKNVCYAFELCSPYNRVVVRHHDSNIILHGARRLSDFKELNPVVVAHQNGWNCVKTYPLESFDDMVNATKEMDPMSQEGFVVCDTTNYNRVKVKSPSYVAVSHLKDGMTTRRLLEIVRTNEGSEFLQYFDEYSDMYHSIKAKYEYAVGFVEGFYEAVKHIDDRKQFAMLVRDNKFSGALFSLKFGKHRSVRAFFADANIKNLEGWLGVKSIELT